MTSPTLFGALALANARPPAPRPAHTPVVTAGVYVEAIRFLLLTDRPHFQTNVANDDVDAWMADTPDNPERVPDPLVHVYQAMPNVWRRLCDGFATDVLRSGASSTRFAFCPVCQAARGELLAAWDDERGQWAE